MKKAKKSLASPGQKKTQVVLQDFITVFASRGWLDQVLRIRHRDRKYRISCNETGFTAYRINDHCGIPPGIPGWPVCFVTHDLVIDDSEMSKFESTEPSAIDWLRCLIDNDLELI